MKVLDNESLERVLADRLATQVSNLTAGAALDLACRLLHLSAGDITGSSLERQGEHLATGITIESIFTFTGTSEDHQVGTIELLVADKVRRTSGLGIHLGQGIL